MDGGATAGDWSRVEESQDVWTVEVEGGGDCGGFGEGADGLLPCGFAAAEPLARACASHASRVLWSTGQAAAGSSWDDIAVLCVKVEMFGTNLGMVTEVELKKVDDL